MYSQNHASQFIASFVELLAGRVEAEAEFRNSHAPKNLNPATGSDWTIEGAST